MLAADKSALEAQLRVSTQEIRDKELTYYVRGALHLL